jgi:hypothetical protein
MGSHYVYTSDGSFVGRWVGEDKDLFTLVKDTYGKFRGCKWMYYYATRAHKTQWYCACVEESGKIAHFPAMIAPLVSVAK